jgi:hypothetical protein
MTGSWKAETALEDRGNCSKATWSAHLGGLDTKRFRLTTSGGRPPRTREPLRIRAVAAGVKMPSRPRLKQSHPLTRHQSGVCARECIMSIYNDENCHQRPANIDDSNINLGSTPGHHRAITGATPSTSRACEEGRRQKEE